MTQHIKKICAVLILSCFCSGCDPAFWVLLVDSLGESAKNSNLCAELTEQLQARLATEPGVIPTNFYIDHVTNINHSFFYLKGQARSKQEMKTVMSHAKAIKRVMHNEIIILNEDGTTTPLTIKEMFLNVDEDNTR